MENLNIDRQEFMQDIESTIYNLKQEQNETDSGPLKEWQDKIKELASIHRQLKNLGY